jgi:hypothetical protein
MSSRDGPGNAFILPIRADVSGFKLLIRLLGCSIVVMMPIWYQERKRQYVMK